MALLNKRERILDVVLTDKGRELLSQGLLDFKYYAFSDEGVDYSGSLARGGNFENNIKSTFTFEADQRSNEMRQSNNRDLNTFLFTVPSRNQTIPRFVASTDDISGVTLEKKFFYENLLDRDFLPPLIREPKAVIIHSDVESSDFLDRTSNYVKEQKSKATNSAIINKQNYIGMMLSNDYVAVSLTEGASTKDGSIKPISDLVNSSKNTAQKVVAVSEVEENVEVVVSVDSKVILLGLKDSNGVVSSNKEYLVEIFESGSDGLLTKVVENDIINPLIDEVVQDGFSSDLILYREKNNQEDS